MWKFVTYFSPSQQLGKRQLVTWNPGGGGPNCHDFYNYFNERIDLRYFNYPRGLESIPTPLPMNPSIDRINSFT